MNFHDVWSFIHDNQLSLTLAASASVGTMPDVLPSLRALPQWLWAWFHDASKTLMNFKRP